MTEIDISPDLANRSGGVALWRQIADTIRSEIIDGTWPSGSALPTEAELAARFGVNRHTVRRSLKSLAEDGLIRADQGRGTFVQGGRIAYPIGRRTRFSENIGRQAMEPGGRLVASDTVEADLRLAEYLAVPRGEGLTRLVTLHVADGVPLSVGTNWFVTARFPRLVSAYAETGSITRALQHHGVEDYFRRWTKITARIAEPIECERLRLANGAVVLLTEVLNDDADGAPVQFSSVSSAAERIEFVIGDTEG